MNDLSPKPLTWRERLGRRHPILHWLLIAALAVLAGPLMIAASHMSAVLYKDF